MQTSNFRPLSDSELTLVAGGQWQGGAIRTVLQGAAEGAGEAAGETFWEWLTDPSYEDQTASRFNPMESEIIRSDWLGVDMENGLMWRDFDQNGAYEVLGWDGNGDGQADFMWDEKNDRWVSAGTFCSF